MEFPKGKSGIRWLRFPFISVGAGVISIPPQSVSLLSTILLGSFFPSFASFFPFIVSLPPEASLWVPLSLSRSYCCHWKSCFRFLDVSLTLPAISDANTFCSWLSHLHLRAQCFRIILSSLFPQPSFQYSSRSPPPQSRTCLLQLWVLVAHFRTVAG